MPSFKHPWEVLAHGRDRIYAAVVTLPFDPLARLPEEGPDGDAYVATCREWYIHAWNACSNGGMSAQVPLNAKDCGPGLQCVMADDLIGQAPRPPGAGPINFDWLIDSHDHIPEYDSEFRGFIGKPGFTKPLRARKLVFGLRLFAFGLLEWLDAAIIRLETALLPRLRLSAVELKHGKRGLKVELGGRVEPRKVQGKTALILTAFKEKGEWVFSNTKEVTRLTDDVPELKPHLKSVTGRGKHKVIRSLPDVLRRRIELEPPQETKTRRKSGRKA